MPDSCPRPVPPRIVKPRKEGSLDSPIIAVSDSRVLTERGELFNYSDLPTLVTAEPSSIFVTHAVGHMVRDLDKALGENPLWQFRATPIEREVWRPNKQRSRTTIRDTTIAFFGFQGRNKKKGKYHYPISPQTFCLKTVHEIRRNQPEEDDTLIKLMAWGKDLRQFMSEQGIILRPTAGGIAGQLLRDKRFYPEARRKVPRRTNEKMRPYLPGNYYRLYDAETSVRYTAAYLDQSGAHHAAAQSVELPCANNLRQRGRFSTRREVPFLRETSKHFEPLLQQYGLFFVLADIPPLPLTRFPLPCLELPGTRAIYLYSNELDYALSLGVRIRAIVAAWTSPEKESGLRKYAGWALARTAEADSARKPWLKPMLLATYGVLAAKPKEIEFGYKRAKNGETKQYPVGSGFLTVEAKRLDGVHEMPTANVLHRGMIEAETRLQSLKLARALAEGGSSILAVYADSVFVADGTELPLLPDPWRVQSYLTNLVFQSATVFRSDQLSKMPGVPLSERVSKLPPRPIRKKFEKALDKSG